MIELLSKEDRVVLYKKYKNQFTKEDFKKFIEEGKINFSDYQEITGEILSDIDLDLAKMQIMREVDNLKHQKMEWFEYDGHQQRYHEYDVIKMRQAREGLEKALLPQIDWKYPDSRVVVTDPNYFLNMEFAGSTQEQKCFTVEAMIEDDINLIQTIEELMAYDYVAKFDEYLATF